jgi:hypothetical protein
MLRHPTSSSLLFAGLSAIVTFAACADPGSVRPAATIVAETSQPGVIAIQETPAIVVHPTRTEVVTTSAGGRVMNLSDLRALVQEGAWAELVEHLGDILPAQRDAEWQTIAKQAGLGAMSVGGRRGAADGLYLSEALLERYPVLKESRDFMSKRAELGAQAFERCFDKERSFDACGEELKAFVRADPQNQDLAFRLGKLVPPRAHGRLAVPAFAIAIQKSDDPRCQDPDVKRAVLSGLNVPRAGNEDLVAESVQLGNLCWRALEPAITDRMGGDSTDYLKNTCPFVRTRKALSSLMAKTCESALSQSSQH